MTVIFIVHPDSALTSVQDRLFFLLNRRGSIDVYNPFTQYALLDPRVDMIPFEKRSLHEVQIGQGADIRYKRARLGELT